MSCNLEMKIIWAVFAINVGWAFSNSYNYEKMNHIGMGTRVTTRIHPAQLKYLPIFETDQHPSPLPTPKRNIFAGSDYHNLTQGVHRKGNKRVYNQRFDYPARNQGQQLFFRGDYNCILSRLAVNTAGLIPTLLRGGAGYRYFLVLVRAPPGLRMQGRVRAWCRNSSDPYLEAPW